MNRITVISTKEALFFQEKAEKACSWPQLKIRMSEMLASIKDTRNITKVVCFLMTMPKYLKRAMF